MLSAGGREKDGLLLLPLVIEMRQWTKRRPWHAIAAISAVFGVSVFSSKVQQERRREACDAEESQVILKAGKHNDAERGVVFHSIGSMIWSAKVGRKDGEALHGGEDGRQAQESASSSSASSMGSKNSPNQRTGR